jgi:glycosyltransferase involved in cell wall biosynthesis
MDLRSIGMINLSIVTVCFNAEKSIAKTLDSILEQTYRDYELIIIDGVSTDNTVQIIRAKLNEFEAKGITIKFISEKDNGAYDAMNKGASLATGRWITFMNADDYYLEGSVLEQVLSIENIENYDVVYGNTMMNKYGKTLLEKAKEIDTITHHIPFCPQATFIKTNLQKKYGFDTKYSISADYKFFLYLYLNHYKFKKINIDIAMFNFGGLSNKNLMKTYSEDVAVKMEYKILKEGLVLSLKKKWFTIKLNVNKYVGGLHGEY